MAVPPISRVDTHTTLNLLSPELKPRDPLTLEDLEEFRLDGGEETESKFEEESKSEVGSKTEAVETATAEATLGKIEAFRVENWGVLTYSMGWAFRNQVESDEDAQLAAVQYLGRKHDEIPFKKASFYETVAQFCAGDLSNPEQFNFRYRLKQDYYSIFKNLVVKKDNKFNWVYLKSTGEALDLKWQELFDAINRIFFSHIAYCDESKKDPLNFETTFPMSKGALLIQSSSDRFIIIFQMYLLGKGGRGAVYKAVELVSGNMYAHKVEQTVGDSAARAVIRKSFKTEWEASRVLPDDPRIVKAEEVVIIHKRWSLLFPLAGIDLYYVLSSKKLGDTKLSQRQRIDFADQIWNFYRDLAKHQIVHQDIKPENIVLLSPGSGQLGFIDWDDVILGTISSVDSLSGGTPEYYWKSLLVKMMAAAEAQDLPVLNTLLFERMLAMVASTMYTVLTGSHPRPFVEFNVQDDSVPVNMKILKANYPPQMCKFLQRILCDVAIPSSEWLTTWEGAEAALASPKSSSAKK